MILRWMLLCLGLVLWKLIFLVSFLGGSAMWPHLTAVTIPEDSSTVATKTREVLRVHGSVVPATSTSITLVTAQGDVIHVSSH